MGIGFAGVLVMLRPGAGVFDPAAIYPLLAGFFVAFVSVFMKRLSETERPQVIIFWFAAFTTLLAAGPAIAYWRWPEPTLWPAVFALGVLGSLGQYCIVRAFRIADATAVDSIDYTRLIYTGAIGVLVFGEALSWSTIAGACLIVGSTLYIARQGSRKPPPP
jgi:drug/metabolite transporter (DMT)-like permease